MKIFHINEAKGNANVIFFTFTIFIIFIISIEIYSTLSSSDHGMVFAGSATDSKRNQVIIGVIMPDIGHDEMKYYKQLINYLDSKIGQSQVKLIATNSTDELIRLIDEDKVDLYVGSSLISALVNNKTGTIPLVVNEGNNSKKTYSVIITKRVTGPLQIFLLADLLGKKLGVTDTSSGMEYLLPKSYLLHYGLSVNPLPLPPLNASKTSVNYVVTHNAKNTTSSILSGKLGAGAISIDNYEHLPESIKSRIKIIGQTTEVPSDIISYRPELNSTFVTSIKNALLSINSKDSNSNYLKTDSIKFAEFGDRPYFSNITKTALLADLYNSCDPLQILTVQDYCN